MATLTAHAATEPATERTLTELDHVRLTRLLRQAAPPPPALQDILDTCDTVPSREVPADVVTMHTQVRLEDLHTGRRSLVTVCYPQDSAPAGGAVSVLSPLGCALLGLRAGQVARWRLPGGEEQAARLLDLAFQPEASGDYTR